MPVDAIKTDIKWIKEGIKGFQDEWKTFRDTMEGIKNILNEHENKLINHENEIEIFRDSKKRSERFWDKMILGLSIGTAIAIVTYIIPLVI